MPQSGGFAPRAASFILGAPECLAQGRVPVAARPHVAVHSEGSSASQRLYFRLSSVSNKALYATCEDARA